MKQAEVGGHSRKEEGGRKEEDGGDKRKVEKR